MAAHKSKAMTTQVSKSAAEEALEKLANQLTCSVCREEYTRPRVLPCLHVFCEACLQKVVVAQANRLTATCPNCRQASQLPGEGVSTLPSAFLIQNLFEVRDTLEKVRDPKKVKCEKCEEGEAEQFCRNCGQFICQSCLKMHQKWKEFKGHEVCNLEEIEEVLSKRVNPRVVTTRCSHHPTEPIKIYCETCEELICRDCTVKTHRDHNYDLIPDAFPRHRDAIMSSLQPLKRHLASVANTINRVDARSQRLEEGRRRCKQIADAEIDRLQAILEARRKELHSEIDGKADGASKELAAQREQQQWSQAKLSSCVEFVESCVESGTQEEVLSMKSQMLERAQQVDREFEPKQLELGPEKVLTITCRDLSSACQTLGEVSFQFQPTHVKTIDRVNSPRHIAFAAGGEMVVCEHGANCVTVFDGNYKCLRSFGNTGSEESRLDLPRGVAVSPDNTVFVAADHCVKKFTLEGQFISSVGSAGSARLQFKSPWAIAYNGTNNKLYVCDTGNHRITILNLDLSFHGCFGSEGSDPGQFSYPVSVSVDMIGNVLVADFKDKIQIFNKNGRFISSINTVLGQPLNGPVSVSVGADGNVYIVEHGSNRVSVFDDSLHYIKSFGKKGDKDGEFSYPYCITVSSDNIVYVSDTANNRIQLFK